MSSVTEYDLLRWAESLSAVARTGLGFTKSLYEKERFEEILKIAADIRSVTATSETNNEVPRDAEEIFDEWLRAVGEGVPGYVTPKLAVGAIVGNEKEEILLIQRADSGVWLYPTGWADVGYSASEVVAKEVLEETGYEVDPFRLIAVFDGLRGGFSRFPLYSLVFQCRILGGELSPHPLECADAGWFSKDKLPTPMVGAQRWVPHVFAALAGNQTEVLEVHFDRPRTPTWRDIDSS